MKKQTKTFQIRQQGTTSYIDLNKLEINDFSNSSKSGNTDIHWAWENEQTNKEFQQRKYNKSTEVTTKN